ncbi:MAG: hypothetical protein R6W78_16595 [Bacteroidales bacterium]
MTKETNCILLTGANSGIGYATCRILAANGFYIFAGVKDQQDMDYLKGQQL